MVYNRLLTNDTRNEKSLSVDSNYHICKRIDEDIVFMFCMIERWQRAFVLLWAS